jgi:TolA-binding protein
MQRATRFWIGIYSFTAFILLIAVGVFALLAHQSRQQEGAGETANARPTASGPVPEERYQLLARFVPPGYQPSPGADEPREFQEAIQHYLKGDDAGAIPELRATVEAHPDSVEARFYLGICLLLSDRRADGIEQLRSVVSAGNTPYLERARFYLAKALIGQHAISDASQQLKSVVAMHGDMEKRAHVLLSEIEPAS